MEWARTKAQRHKGSGETPVLDIPGDAPGGWRFRSTCNLCEPGTGIVLVLVLVLSEAVLVIAIESASSSIWKTDGFDYEHEHEHEHEHGVLCALALRD